MGRLSLALIAICVRGSTPIRNVPGGRSQSLHGGSPCIIHHRLRMNEGGEKALQDGPVSVAKPISGHDIPTATSDESITPLTRAAAVASELRRMIRSGVLAPGSRLRQADIAARFGMSTTPVREAFTTLAREGIVRQDAHRGVVVFEPSAAELRETYEIRIALESLAADLAAGSLDQEQLDEIGDLVGQMRAERDPQRYVELNRAFHQRIYRAANRPRLFELIEQLRNVASSYTALVVTEHDPDYRDQVQAEHEAIYHALRDGRRAGNLVAAHLRHNLTKASVLVDDAEAG
jgi:DNA-binding GntR family transcriptional regulator